MWPDFVDTILNIWADFVRTRPKCDMKPFRQVEESNLPYSDETQTWPDLVRRDLSWLCWDNMKNLPDLVRTVKRAQMTLFWRNQNMTWPRLDETKIWADFVRTRPWYDLTPFGKEEEPNWPYLDETKTWADLVRTIRSALACLRQNQNVTWLRSNKNNWPGFVWTRPKRDLTSFEQEEQLSWPCSDETKTWHDLVRTRTTSDLCSHTTKMWPDHVRTRRTTELTFFGQIVVVESLLWVGPHFEPGLAVQRVVVDG